MGIEFESVSNYKLCPLACPSGSFKPTQGDEPCMQCPINSRTTSEGAINCVCRNGYYRTDSDPLQMPCTSTYLTIICCTHSWETLEHSPT